MATSPDSTDSSPPQSKPSSDAPVKGFHIFSRAWYARAGEKPSITIGLYYPSGGCDAEVSIKWHDLNSTGTVPRIEIFDDAWKMFFQMDELRPLAEFTNKNAGEQTVVEFLLSAGFKDLTEYEGPKPLKPYSILLLYPEGNNEGGAETYLASVNATDKATAITDARAEMCRVNDWSTSTASELSVLLVTEGHIIDLGEAS
ncbi:MAG: hypothetical protein ABI693_33865 [Bryobacteraceae bacterium]